MQQTAWLAQEANIRVLVVEKHVQTAAVGAVMGTTERYAN
jgi:hypothetical protein